MKLRSWTCLGAALAVATGFGMVARAPAQEPALLDVRPSEIKFSSVAVDRCAARKFEMINSTDAPVVGLSYALDDSKAFALRRGLSPCSDSLEPGGRCRAYVRFCPLSTGTHRATLVISYSGMRRTVPVVGHARNQGGR